MAVGAGFLAANAVGGVLRADHAVTANIILTLGIVAPLALMRLVDRLFMAGRLRANLELMALLQRLGERGDPAEANRLLGAPTTTVGQWCQRHAASRTAG